MARRWGSDSPPLPPPSIRTATTNWGRPSAPPRRTRRCATSGTSSITTPGNSQLCCSDEGGGWSRDVVGHGEPRVFRVEPLPDLRGRHLEQFGQAAHQSSRRSAAGDHGRPPALAGQADLGGAVFPPTRSRESPKRRRRCRRAVLGTTTPCRSERRLATVGRRESERPQNLGTLTTIAVPCSPTIDDHHARSTGAPVGQGCIGVAPAAAGCTPSPLADGRVHQVAARPGASERRDRSGSAGCIGTTPDPGRCPLLEGQVDTVASRSPGCAPSPAEGSRPVEPARSQTRGRSPVVVVGGDLQRSVECSPSVHLQSCSGGCWGTGGAVA